ncbi:ABC transporter permease [Sporosalibacterium faouarense]|uniref:ABC transporter permease n=1 Tax=Sporosalibacterium faouarense TaxID=516123 RepID=UPI00192CAD9E|nr:ABC transporter permease [Sporosalibacterium faouarense]
MRISALITRIITQFFRDKRTLGLMILAPILVLFLVNLTFNGEEYDPKIAVYDFPEQIEDSLVENGAILKDVSLDKANELIKNKEIDAIIERDGLKSKIALEGSDPSVNKRVVEVFQNALQELSQSQNNPKPDIQFIYGGEDMELFDNLGPVLIGFFIFFFVFLIAGISLLRERSSGTLEKLLSTPLRRYEIVLGYVFGFGLFTTIQSAIISWYAISVLGIMMKGSFIYVLLITFLLSMSALTLGTLLSTFANNELQMMQFIPIVVIPQVFFSGIFNLDTFNKILRGVSKIMPLTYGANALREVMIRGKGWSSIYMDILFLLAFSVLFIILNILALKRYRSI